MRPSVAGYAFALLTAIAPSGAALTASLLGVKAMPCWLIAAALGACSPEQLHAVLALGVRLKNVLSRLVR